MRKKIMFLMCMAALLVVFLGVGVVSANTVSPDVTVVAAKIGDSTLELGLRIDSSNDTFQSTGVVLQYDATAIKPCGWADAETDALNALLTQATVEKSALGADENVWDYAVPLPTKGMDFISGKTAFTVIVKDGDTETGYLYLNVEAPVPARINQTQPVDGAVAIPDTEDFVAANHGFKTNYGLEKTDGPMEQVITVCFALPGGTGGEPEGPDTPDPGPEGPDTPEPEPEPEPEPSPEEPESQSDEGGDSGETTDPEEPENPPTPPAATPENLMDTYDIAVVGDAIAVNSPAGGSGAYYSTTDSNGIDISNWHFLSVAKGVSVNTGGFANPSDFVTVVCYDWDNTLLGSVTVPKGLPATEVQPYMDAFVASLQSPESKDVNPDKSAYYVDDENFPLTYKRGYSFLTWLPNDSDLPTHCGRAVDGGNKLITIENPVTVGKNQSFEGLQSNITVKACYQDNSELHYVDDPLQMGYSMRAKRFTRIGNSQNYSITFEFVREKEVDGVKKGVPRLIEPQARVVYNGNLYNFFALGTSDVVTFTVYPAGGAVTRVEGAMVDFYNVSVLTTASQKAVADTITNGANAKDRDGYRHKGTIGLINDELANNSTTFLTAAIMKTQGDLTYTNLNEARSNLRKAWVTLNSEDGTDATIKSKDKQQDLTFDQMNYAIANGGALMP